MKKHSTRFHRQVIPNDEIRGQGTKTLEVVPTRPRWQAYSEFAVTVVVRTAETNSSFDSFFNFLGLGDDKSLGAWKRTNKEKVDCLLLREGFLLIREERTETPVKSYVYMIHRTLDWPNKTLSEQVKAAREVMGHIDTPASHDKIIFVAIWPLDDRYNTEPCVLSLQLAGLVQHGTPVVPSITTQRFFEGSISLKPPSTAHKEVFMKFGMFTRVIYWKLVSLRLGSCARA
eukprot:GHVS01069585.1.p1 GENE.GHVS01069585.1~~GHVS01069585.1.p1  ORF type:complete len:230 (-),score=2.68 GHVS01069585.1:387-1076(-)